LNLSRIPPSPVRLAIAQLQSGSANHAVSNPVKQIQTTNVVSTGASDTQHVVALALVWAKETKASNVVGVKTAWQRKMCIENTSAALRNWLRKHQSRLDTSTEAAAT